jgi:hypothetical protein
MKAEEVAQLFYETYERLAPSFGYETRHESAVPWSDVPEKNKKLMIAVAREVEYEVERQATRDLREVIAEYHAMLKEYLEHGHMRVLDSEVKGLQRRVQKYITKIYPAE